MDTFICGSDIDSMLTPLDPETAGPSTANDVGSNETDFWDNFEAHEESYKEKTTAQLSPSTEKQKQICEELLFQFTEQYLKKKNSSITVDNFLRETPPNPFWKTLLRFLATSPSNMKYSKNGYTKIRDSYTTSTVRLQMSICLTLYKRFSGVAADPEQVQACWNLLKDPTFIKETGLRSPKAKEWSTFDDCKYFIEFGVFGDSWKFKNARERLQMAAMVLLAAFTAARPGDLIRSIDYGPNCDCLKYKDLTFYAEKLEDDSISLSVDVAIRQMKGLRNDDSAVRIQQLYQHRENLLPLYDVTLHLATMALMDDVFEDFQAIQDIYKIDPEKVEKAKDPTSSMKRTEILIKESKKELPVLRGFVFDRASKWSTSLTEVWKERLTSTMLDSIRRKIGMHDFNFQSVRRGCATLLNKSDVTSVDAQTAIGHRKGTSTYKKHYLAKRSQVDLQGLMVTGNQATERIIAPAKVYAPMVELSKFELQEIEEEPSVVTATSGHLQLRETLFSQHKEAWKAVGVTQTSDIKLGGIQCSSAYKDVTDATLQPALQLYMKSANELDKLRRLFRQRKQYEKSQNVARNKRQQSIQAQLGVLPSNELNITKVLDVSAEHVASSTLSSHLPPCKKGLKIKEALESIREKYMKHIDPVIDVNDLLTPGQCIAEASIKSVTLLTSGYGTWTTKLVSDCPNCGQHKGFPKDQLQHYLTCSSETIADDIKEKVTAIFSGEECMRLNCERTFAEHVDGGANAIMEHFSEHRKKSCRKCPFRDDDSKPCGFQFTVKDFSTDAILSEFRVHLQVCHGILYPCSTNIIFCHEHQQWLIGEDDVENHFRSHLKTKLPESMPRKESEKICLHCWRDEDLRPSKRAKIWSTGLQKHTTTMHFSKKRKR